MKRSIARTRLIGYLDDYLKIASIPDRSLNGLQVEGRARIERAAFAVDASLETIRAASRAKADILIVHHGLFWSRGERITGVMRKRIGALLESGLSLYAAHLPLDCHEEVGNNAEIARLLGFEIEERFGDYHGVLIGYTARVRKPVGRSALARAVEKALRCRVERLNFGPAKVRRVGIVSGGAAEFAEEAKALGCEAFITGETSHSAYHPAKEAGITVLYAGHYASETVGVKALARHLERKFGIECRFLAAPTGF